MGLETSVHGIGMSQKASMLESPYLHKVGRWSSRGGGDGGGRALPLPLPPGWGGEYRGRSLPLADHVDRPPRHLSTKLLIIFGVPALPHWIGGEEDPRPSSLLLLTSSIAPKSTLALPLPIYPL